MEILKNNQGLRDLRLVFINEEVALQNILAVCPKLRCSTVVLKCKVPQHRKRLDSLEPTLAEYSKAHPKRAIKVTLVGTCGRIKTYDEGWQKTKQIGNLTIMQTIMSVNSL